MQYFWFINDTNYGPTENSSFFYTFSKPGSRFFIQLNSTAKRIFKYKKIAWQLLGQKALAYCLSWQLLAYLTDQSLVAGLSTAEVMVLAKIGGDPEGTNGFWRNASERALWEIIDCQFQPWENASWFRKNTHSMRPCFLESRWFSASKNRKI